MGAVATIVHDFDWPDRFVTGTVGEPGARTFFLQVADRVRTISVILEKQQSAALADGMDTLLDELMGAEGNPHSVPEAAPEGLRDEDPLTEPVVAAFRTGAMTLAWDPATAQVVVQAIPLVESDDEDLDEGGVGEAEPTEALVVRIPVGTARAFADRARRIVRAGRPICPLCEEPMDADGHTCPE